MQDKKAGNRFALLLKDAGKAFLLGLAVAAGVFILLLAVGAVSHGFSALAGLELARRGLFIVGALALLVSWPLYTSEAADEERGVDLGGAAIN